MAESVSNETPIEGNVESRELIPINADVKEVMRLRELVENLNKKVKYWRSQTSKLFQSNYNIETCYDKLAMEVSNTDTKVSKNVEVYTAKKQELKDFQNKRTNISRKEWDDYLSEIGNYANNFCQWLKRYSRDILMKDIKNHQKECEKVREELSILKQEVNDMLKQYDLEYIEANVDNNNNLSNFNIVMSDVKASNNNLTHVVRLTEDTLSKVQNKIKRSKIVVNEYKLNEKTTLF